MSRARTPSAPVVLLTGLPSSGKTTIGELLAARLRAHGRASEILDGDELRERLPPELGFDRVDRAAQGRRAGFLAELLSANDVIPVLALVAPLGRTREEYRSQFAATGYLEVFLAPPLDVCVERDSHGIYRRCAAGGDLAYAAIVDVYEPPTAPTLRIDTSTVTIADSVDRLAAAALRHATAVR